jgi:L-histidine N-alpha-methyltransferase
MSAQPVLSAVASASSASASSAAAAVPAAPVFVQQYREDSAAIRRELAEGLSRQPAAISPKYLYDLLGSRLFEAITLVPEYYPTRTEAAIFAEHGAAIAQAVGPGATLVDLGAGNCQKAASLFGALRPVQYVAVDISVDFLRDALVALQQQHAELPMLGLGTDFSTQLKLPPAVRRERRVFFYPGSSLGNFTPDEALAFLQRLREACDRSGGILLGIDLVKDKAVLDAAYDDALGVTAAFNLNLLLHLNRMLDADFDLRQWKHVAFFDPELSRIEMHLEARCDVTVRWRGGARAFPAGARIHTESSYKYRPAQLADLFQAAGFTRPRIWTDAHGWFAVCYAGAA